MGFSCALVGLPNAGKSTIYNALSGAGARVESYPFSTIEAHRSVVEVPDERLDALHAIHPEKRRVPTSIEIVDVAGLVRGASAGEGMGNQFLSEIRAVDAILHVVRCFDDENVAHIAERVDPRRDIEIVDTELLLKDLETLGRIAERARREAKGADRGAATRAEAWDLLVQGVARGEPVRRLEIPREIAEGVRDAAPLTAKPMLLVANVGEDGGGEHLAVVRATAEESGAQVVVVHGKVEAEILEAAEAPQERLAFLGEWGLTSTGLDRLIRAGYGLLQLSTFFTFEGPEVRAWTVRAGTTAAAAGGKIHSDFEHRFVTAEVMALSALSEAGSEKALRDRGGIHRAGHDYVVQDGDVIRFVCG